MTASVAQPGTPPAEIPIDADQVRRLLTAQHPDLAGLPLVQAASGWDNVMFRLGDALAVRLPRRLVGVRLLETEQTWLPRVAPGLPLAAPIPLRLGAPGKDFPWPWSIIPWLEGETADLALPDSAQGEVVGRFFRALHVPAPKDAPRSAHRGVPLGARQDSFAAQLQNLSGKTDLITPAVLELWRAGVAAPMDVGPTWLHGDPHPRNVLVRDGAITAFIDWGDMCQGDRASDLAAIWMLLPDRTARAAAMDLCGASDATWARARGWAVWYGAILLSTGLANDPRMTPIAERIFARLDEGP
jgi:aminoglycoside phosphotransferase (APT) family kinase protein